jgi:hypothetical protein
MKYELFLLLVFRHNFLFANEAFRRKHLMVQNDAFKSQFCLFLQQDVSLISSGNFETLEEKWCQIFITPRVLN